MANIVKTPEQGNEDLGDILRKQLTAFSMANEISRVVSSARDLESVLTTLTLGLQEMLGFPRVAVLGLERNSFGLRPLKTLGDGLQSLASSPLGLDFLSGEYADAIFRNRHVIVDPVPDYDGFHGVQCQSYAVFPILGRIVTHCWEVRQCGMTHCPCYEGPNPVCWAVEGAALDTGAQTEDERRRACTLCSQFKCLGLLWLDLTGRSMITGDEVSMVTSIAAQSGMVLENFQMYDSLQLANRQLSSTNKALQEANRLIQRDLRQANGIQKKLLPSQFPQQLKDVASHYVPYSEVGGDYYDCFEIAPGQFGMVVADVSGHGVTAALVMSMFKMLLKGEALANQSPAEVLKRINATFLRELASDQFVTVFYAIWNQSERKLTWTNAGHDPILLMHLENGSITELKSSGLFVGVFDDIRVQDTTLSLAESHRLLLYTDGVNEAANSLGEQFGMPRLHAIFQDTRENPCPDLIGSILGALDEFTGSEPLKDDITLLACDL